MEARRKVCAQVEASMEARREVWIEERSRAWVEIWKEVEKKAQHPREAWKS